MQDNQNYVANLVHKDVTDMMEDKSMCDRIS